MSTLVGKPAGIVILNCPNCSGDAFKIFGPAPKDVVIGGTLPDGEYVLTTAECVACGEWIQLERKVQLT